MEQLLELHLPNILGAEKEAIKQAVTIAEKMGFARDRIEDLKTALAEACINAIEHGNKFDENKKVRRMMDKERQKREERGKFIKEEKDNDGGKGRNDIKSMVRESKSMKERRKKEGKEKRKKESQY